jgi:hypothetical protein
MRSVFVLVLTLCFCSLAGAQHTGHSRAKAAAEQPATIVPGIGGVHHPVSTTNPQAQKFFDQGLAFVFAFNHDEAIRSFKRAAELDPRLAMTHWGMALGAGTKHQSRCRSGARKGGLRCGAKGERAGGERA